LAQVVASVEAVESKALLKVESEPIEAKATAARVESTARIKAISTTTRRSAHWLLYTWRNLFEDRGHFSVV
jgi:hypothetical protein